MVYPVVVGSGMRLLPLTDDHLGLEIELDSDPAVMRYLTGRGASRAEAEQAHRRRVAPAHELPGLGFWVGLARDKFLGWCLLGPTTGPNQPKVAGETELGYRVLRRQWHRGYASERGHELNRYGFKDGGLNRIFAQTLAVNAPSQATMTAVGSPSPARSSPTRLTTPRCRAPTKAKSATSPPQHVAQLAGMRRRPCRLRIRQQTGNQIRAPGRRPLPCKGWRIG